MSLVSAAVLSVILVAAQRRNPHWGFVLMAGLIPIVQVLPQTETFSSVLLIAGGSSVLAYVISRDRNDQFGIPSGPTTLFLALLLMLEVSLQEPLKPPQQAHSYFYFPFLYFQLVVLVYVVGQVFRNSKMVEQLMIPFVAVSIVAAALSLLLFHTQLTSENEYLAGMTRNQNAFATYLGIAMLMLVYFGVNSEAMLHRLVSLLVAGLLVVPLLLSGSRGAALFLPLALAYQLLRTRARGVLYFLLFLVGITQVQWLIPAHFFARMGSIPTESMRGTGTVGERLSYWRYALELWRHSPVFGIGSGMFYEKTISTWRFGMPRVTHNMYVTYLCEEGFVGLALLVAIIAAAFWNFERASRAGWHDKKARNLPIAWQSIMLFLVLSGLKAELGTDKLLWISFGLSSALLAATASDDSGANHLPPDPGPVGT
jgi:O-antigen ligase